MDTLRITGDFQFGYNDYSFTRISPRQVQSYKIHANYKPRDWINLDGAIDLHENRDNVSTVNDIEHSRSYSFVTTFMPKSKLFFDLGYTYTDIYNQAEICYYDNAFGPPPTSAAKLVWATPRPQFLAWGRIPAGNIFCMATSCGNLCQRVTASVGYAGDFRWRQYARDRPVPGTRHPCFQLSEALCEGGFRLGQGLELPNDVELLRLQRQGAGFKRNTGSGGNSGTGFQRQHR